MWLFVTEHAVTASVQWLKISNKPPEVEVCITSELGNILTVVSVMVQAIS
jgi:hypothetical protein